MDVFQTYNAFIREVATSKLETIIRFSGNAITWRRSKKATGQKKCGSQDSRALGTPCVLSSNLCKAMNQLHASKNFMEMLRDFFFSLMHLSDVYSYRKHGPRGVCYSDDWYSLTQGHVGRHGVRLHLANDKGTNNDIFVLAVPSNAPYDVTSSILNTYTAYRELTLTPGVIHALGR